MGQILEEEGEEENDCDKWHLYNSKHKYTYRYDLHAALFSVENRIGHTSSLLHQSTDKRETGQSAASALASSWWLLICLLLNYSFRLLFPYSLCERDSTDRLSRAEGC